MFCIFNHCLKLWNFYQKRKKVSKLKQKKAADAKSTPLIPRTYISHYYNVIVKPTMTMLLKLKTMRF